MLLIESNFSILFMAAPDVKVRGFFLKLISVKSAVSTNQRPAI